MNTSDDLKNISGLLDEAEKKLQENDYATASYEFTSLLGESIPKELMVRAISGLGKCYIGLNKFSELTELINTLEYNIKKESENLTSTLAILPDTKEINTFNLEAEASRQGEFVAVRQVISNEETYKDDLEFFDWFLIKTGDQGVMSNEAKNLLNQYLLKSPSSVSYTHLTLPTKRIV